MSRDGDDNQDDLFKRKAKFPEPDPHKLYRDTDPDTSEWAAENIAPKLNMLQQQVLDWYEEQTEDWTDIEAAPLLDRRYTRRRSQTWRSRRAELTEMGYIIYAGHKKFIDGSWHQTWRAKNRK